MSEPSRQFLYAWWLARPRINAWYEDEVARIIHREFPFDENRERRRWKKRR